jgi:hypothetical protein
MTTEGRTMDATVLQARDVAAGWVEYELEVAIDGDVHDLHFVDTPST